MAWPCSLLSLGLKNCADGTASVTMFPAVAPWVTVRLSFSALLMTPLAPSRSLVATGGSSMLAFSVVARSTMVTSSRPVRLRYCTSLPESTVRLLMKAE